MKRKYQSEFLRLLVLPPVPEKLKLIKELITNKYKTNIYLL